MEDNKEKYEEDPVRQLVLVSQDSKRYLEEKKLGVIHDLSNS